jgi:iron(III) transport system substrate-binding protein
VNHQYTTNHGFLSKLFLSRDHLDQLMNPRHIAISRLSPPQKHGKDSQNMDRRVATISFLIILFGALLLAFRPWRPAHDLVIYCSHDAIYSSEIIAAFEQATGLRALARFDSEATKSLGLVELIRAEGADGSGRSRADVFWNNELLGTLDLQSADLLDPYIGPSHQRIPDAHKDPDGHWAGFGSRARVIIVNTDILPDPDLASLEAQIAQGDLSRFAIAKPIYGTTLTHYTILWHHLGAEAAQAWHQSILDRGARIVLGNATTKDLVAAGVCDFAFTDTDDFALAQIAGAPVTALPARVAGRPIAIPNTVALLKGAPNPKAARAFIDFLLSEEVELALARSPARQVPLGTIDPALLPEEVRVLQPLVDDAYPLNDLIDARAEVLAWLKTQSL